MEIPVIDRLRIIYYTDRSISRREMIKLMKEQHGEGKFEHCSEYFRFVLFSILKSEGNNDQLIKYLIESDYFDNSYLLETIPLCLKTTVLETRFKIINGEYQINEQNAFQLLVNTLDQSEILIISKAVTAKFYNTEKYESTKKMLLNYRTEQFKILDIGYAETFKILEEVKCYATKAEFVELILERTDHILNRDAVFSTRYALTLLKNCSKTLQRYENAIIIQSMIDYLERQINNPNPEFEKLNIALELIYSFVVYKPVYHQRVSEWLSIFLRNNNNALLLQNMKHLKNKLAFYMTYFETESNDSLAFRHSETSNIAKEDEVEDFLDKNVNISFVIYFDAIRMEQNAMEKIRRLISLCTLTDSFCHPELHAQILRCVIENRNELPMGFEELSRVIRRSLNIYEVLKNWVKESDRLKTSMEAPNSFEILKTIAQFMILQDTNIAENRNKMIDIAVIFLEKVECLDLNQAIDLNDTISDIKENVMYRAGEKLLSKDQKRIVYSSARTLEIRLLFFNRDTFVECLLKRSHFLTNPSTNFQDRFAFTMAQCGYDETNKYQIDPTESEENAETVHNIYLYLWRTYDKQKNLQSLEVPVQIFKNFVKINPFKRFIIDSKGIQRTLIDWVRRNSTDGDVYDARLKNKVDDLFDTNLRYCEQPSFGSRFEVFSEDRLDRFLKSKQKKMYLTDHDP